MFCATLAVHDVSQMRPIEALSQVHGLTIQHPDSADEDKITVHEEYGFHESKTRAPHETPLILER